MNLLDVVPPFGLMIILRDHFVDTRLSEVLVNNITTRNSMELVFDMIWGAVFTITEALFLLEVCGASRTAPRDKTWLNINISLQLVRISIELLNKV